MAPLILLMRGENIIARDFKYYSPCTGELDKDAFLGLLRTTDRAFPTMKTFAGSFTVSQQLVLHCTIRYMLVLSTEAVSVCLRC